MSDDDMTEACMLHVLNVSEKPLTTEEMAERMNKLSQEDRNNALARYQEHKEEG